LVDEACDQGDDGGVVVGPGAAAFSERGHGVVEAVVMTLAGEDPHLTPVSSRPRVVQRASA
jgi:hypothetical protein